MTDLLKLAEENDRFHSGKDLYEAVELSNKNAAALREAHETIEYNVKKRIEMQDELTRLHTENQQLRAELENEQKERREDLKTLEATRAENERLKGKIISPDVTTMCYCDDCGAATRWGRHLDIDCETIKSLRDQNIIYVTAISGLHEQIRKLRAEVQRFWDIFSPDVSIEMLEEGLQARVELQKLRAELEAANVRAETALTFLTNAESNLNGVVGTIKAYLDRDAKEEARLAALKEVGNE